MVGKVYDEHLLCSTFPATQLESYEKKLSLSIQHQMSIIINVNRADDQAKKNYCGAFNHE